MLPFFNKSIARKTLLNLSLSIGAVIALMTVVIYQHVVSVITEKSIEQLDVYTAERGRHEGQLFKLATDNHLVLRAVILKKLKEGQGAPDPKVQFDALHERFPDGAVRNRLKGFDGTRDPFVFIGPNVEINAEIRRRVMLFLNLSREFGPAWHHKFQNVYFTMPENILVGYWPEVPDWAHRASADLKIPEEEYFWVADPAHNAERKTVLTGLFYDEPSKSWMVSIETPVDVAGRHVATIGHDILLNELMDRSIAKPLDGAYNIIFTKDGRLISHPKLMDEIKAKGGRYDINRNGDANLKRIFEAVVGNKTGKRVIQNSVDAEYLATFEMKSAGWYFTAVYPKNLVSDVAWGTAQVVLTLGLLSLVAGIIFLYWILKDQVQAPIRRLVDVARRIVSGDYEIKLKHDRDDEVGQLSQAFNAMAASFKGRARELEESSRMLRATMGHIAQGLVVFDDDLKVLDFNEHYRNILRLPRDFLRRGIPLQEVIRYRVERGDFGEGDVEEIYQRRVIQAMRPGARTDERALADGMVYLFHRVPREGGGYVTTYTNLTDRKLTERLLREHEEYQAGILRNASDGIITIDQQGRIETFNPSAEQVFGYAYDEVRGRNVSLLMPEPDKSLHDSYLAAYNAGGMGKIIGVGPREVMGRRKDGSTFPLSLAVSVMDVNGQRKFIGVTRDITLQKQVERQAAQKSLVLESTIQTMAQGCVVFDADLRLVAFNESYEKMFCYPPHALQVGMPLAEVVSLRGTVWSGTSDAPRADKIKRHIDRAQYNVERESERRLNNGTVYIYHRKPLADGGFISTYTDITARKEMENDIRQSLKAAEIASLSKSEFLANMSHELRTPLNAIIGFSEIIKGGRFGPIGNKRYEEYMDDIYKSGQHLLILINDILDLSKGEAGKIELLEEVFDPAMVIGECLRMVKVAAAKQEIDLTANFVRGEVRLHADRKLFKQIIINLLSNAIKFTAPGGKIKISGAVAPMSGYALSVQDNGIGIAPEDIPRILEPFSQIQSAMSRNHQGAGLGLPLVKRLVECHGGSLDIQSKLGEGTTVTVRFPKERSDMEQSILVGSR